MSMGGCYVSINENELNTIISENKSLSDFVFRREKDLPSCSLEQAWDAVRILFTDNIPDIFGIDVLEGVDLGETCFIISPEDAALVSKQLNDTTDDDITDMYHSSSFQNEDFYWADFWKEENNFNDIKDMIKELQQFFIQVAEDGNAVLFYIG